jgi:isochorismate hydrolase
MVSNPARRIKPMAETTPQALKSWLALTPDTTQVLICDLQGEIVARSKTTPPDTLAQSAVVLCSVARLLDIPITLSVVPEGGKSPKLIAPLQEFAADGNQFPRTNVNPFLDEKTATHLKSSNRRTLIIAGFATEAVVLHTAISSISNGYNAVVALDACGGMSLSTESAAFEQIRACGGIVSPVTSIVTALAPDFTTDKGKQMFEIVQKLRLA